MNGLSIKKIIVATGGDLNEYDYFDNTKIYMFDEIPDIYVNAKKFKTILSENYDENMCNYIYRSLKKDGKINLKQFLNFMET